MFIYDNKDYMLDLCIRMAHHSTAIEGNTLSLNDTSSIILNSYISKPMNEREFYEVKNYKEVLPLLIQSLKDKQSLDNELIKSFHSIIMKDLIYNNGKFKTIDNLILGSNMETSKPYLVPTKLKDLCANLYFRFENAKDETEKINAILQAHIDFEKIHPFSDGNGRTGRLMMIYSCLEQNITPIVIEKEHKQRYINILRNNDNNDFFALAKELQEKEEQRLLVFKNNALLNDFYERLNTYKKKAKILNPSAKHKLENKLLKLYKDLEKNNIKVDESISKELKNIKSNVLSR
ncbi:Fic family protein [Campylobacter avium]|uniref:Fic family protein n=1 Tax=Campylobacter avium TaxID=522485 RepID=UPI00255C1B97|nr:Fic family protein [Campylobacter avium]